MLRSSVRPPHSEAPSAGTPCTRSAGTKTTACFAGSPDPPPWITAELQDEGLLAGPVTPVLTPLYPDGVRASGFRVPAEVVALLRGTSPDQCLVWIGIFLVEEVVCLHERSRRRPPSAVRT
jgi:hypothetical protein